MKNIKELKNQLPAVWGGFLIAGLIFLLEFTEDDVYFFSATIGGFIFYLYCIYSFHRILERITEKKYSVNPLMSVVGMVLPFYNLYWVFKWPIEISKFINNHKINMVNGTVLGLLLLVGSIIGRIDTAIAFLILFGILYYINNKIGRLIDQSATK